MGWFDGAIARLRLMARRRADEARMAEEFRFHLEMETEKNVRSGMSPEEARRRAILAFGGIEQHKEGMRDGRGARWLEDLILDLRHSARSLRKTPGFTMAAVLTLALGIGANTALFSIVKTVILEPLPYPDAHELVSISQYGWIPAEIVLDLKQRGESFEASAAYYPQSFAVTGAGEPLQLEGAQVTPNFFRLLRVGVVLGRDFVESDARLGGSHPAIINYGIWQRRYGGSYDVIGQTLEIDGELHEIVGVLPRGFRLFAPRSENPRLWIPFEVAPTNSKGFNDGLNFVIPLARLSGGVSLREAEAELDLAVSRFKERHPETNPGWDLDWAPLKSGLLEHRMLGAAGGVQNVRTPLVVLQLAVGALLLIACVNMTNLLLARFGSRRTEGAIRAALGASRGRLLRQTMTESVLLALLGGAAGLLLLPLGLKAVLAVAPHVPRIDDVSIDVPVLLFALAITFASGLLVGAIPAMIASRPAPNDVLKEGGRTTGGSRRQHRIGQALVISEVALTVVLLVAAGLLGRTFVSLIGQDPGFRTASILAVSMQVPENRYQSMPELTSFYRRVLERLHRVPGIESVALSKNPPISRGGSTRDYVLEGEAGTADRSAEYDVISPGYFRILDIPLLKGRAFEVSDRRGSLPVAIVDAAMWRDAWPGQDPIGKRFRFEEDRWLTVVGVVGNIRGSGLANDPGPGFYISYQQRPETPTALAVAHTHTVFLARPRAEADALAGSLRRGIWDVDPQQPVPEIATLESLVSRGVSPQRFRALLLGSFAATALMLVIVGIYGVIEYLVAQRTHEFGIRMAMGATGSSILKRVMSWALPLTAVGVVLGLVGVFAVGRFLRSMLFGVTPTDPTTILTSVLTIVLVTVVACLIPARKATQVDPTTALQSERRPAK